MTTLNQYIDAVVSDLAAQSMAQDVLRYEAGLMGQTGVDFNLISFACPAVFVLASAGGFTTPGPGTIDQTLGVTLLLVTDGDERTRDMADLIHTLALYLPEKTFGLGEDTAGDLVLGKWTTMNRPAWNAEGLAVVALGYTQTVRDGAAISVAMEEAT